jgi:hypothetical protein
MREDRRVTAGQLSDCRPLDAINPSDGKTWQLFVRTRKIEAVAKRGMGAAKELAYTVPWAVKHPCAIFRGVRDEGEQDWLCYVAAPSQAYDYKTGDTVEAWKGEVFLVFVNDDRIIYNWRWEEADPINPKLPKDWEHRYTEKVLP